MNRSGSSFYQNNEKIYWPLIRTTIHWLINKVTDVFRGTEGTFLPACMTAESHFKQFDFLTDVELGLLLLF